MTIVGGYGIMVKQRCIVPMTYCWVKSILEEYRLFCTLHNFLCMCINSAVRHIFQHSIPNA